MWLFIFYFIRYWRNLIGVVGVFVGDIVEFLNFIVYIVHGVF